MLRNDSPHISSKRVQARYYNNQGRTQNFPEDGYLLQTFREQRYKLDPGSYHPGKLKGTSQRLLLPLKCTLLWTARLRNSRDR